MTPGEQERGYTEDFWCPASSGSESAQANASTPLIDGALWVALLKMSNGDTIAPAEQEWLVAQKLAETMNGVTILTARGRAALGV